MQASTHLGEADAPKARRVGASPYEMPDHLGSTSIVVDGASGEVVERGTYMAYGQAESDYRPGRWGSFREDYRFTGKEEDVEVGLQYFGKRFYAPQLNRWVSADPLPLSTPGKGDPNVYAYVKGSLLKAIDPVGLDPKLTGPEAYGVSKDARERRALRRRWG